MGRRVRASEHILEVRPVLAAAPSGQGLCPKPLRFGHAGTRRVRPSSVARWQAGTTIPRISSRENSAYLLSYPRFVSCLVEDDVWLVACSISGLAPHAPRSLSILPRQTVHPWGVAGRPSPCHDGSLLCRHNRALVATAPALTLAGKACGCFTPALYRGIDWVGRCVVQGGRWG